MPDLPLIIDCFAGGGGASTGIELALGRSPDVAINHNSAALALHAANHPQTLHLDSNIWDVDPAMVTRGRKVGMVWASPDCKHFSKAKGAAVRDRNIRDLAWVVHRWARLPRAQRPDVILLENVEEFVTWGPVGEDGQPIREFAGQTFRLWVRQLRELGYRVQWREMRACDYGAPTIRKRFFLVARCDGRPIVWPKPTHGDPASLSVRRGHRLPWRTAAEIIDWSLPCPSIFATSAEIMAEHGLRAVRPLADNTLARIARGMARYMLQAERPFLVSLKGIKRSDASVDRPHKTILCGGHSGLIAPYLARTDMTSAVARNGIYSLMDPLRTQMTSGAFTLIAPVLTYAQQGGGNRTACSPHHTICASRKDQNALIAASLVQTGYGERAGQAPRALDIAAPLGTVVAGGAKHAPIAAFLAQQNGGPRMAEACGRPAQAPLSTLTQSGSQQMPVAAWFAKYYGTGDGARIDDPFHTVTVRDRFGHMQAALQAPPFGPEHAARARQVADFLRAHGAWSGGDLVTLQIDGATFVIVDIGMRMLTPRELFRAQGFPDDYVIDGHWIPEGDDWRWVSFPKDVQISCCGNSVCPDLARALVAANCGHLRAADVVQEQEASL